MDVTKSIKDAGYIAVGAGVIGFQQAQVRRREIGSEVARRADGARACAENRLETLRTQVATQTSRARTNVEGQAQGVRDRTTTGISGVTTGISGVTSSLSDVTTGLADDVRELIDPVVGEARVRVEPLVEQLQAVPDHVARAVDAGRSRVFGLVGAGAPATAA